MRGMHDLIYKHSLRLIYYTKTAATAAVDHSLSVPRALSLFLGRWRISVWHICNNRKWFGLCVFASVREKQTVFVFGIHFRQPFRWPASPLAVQIGPARIFVQVHAPQKCSFRVCVSGVLLSPSPGLI